MNAKQWYQRSTWGRHCIFLLLVGHCLTHTHSKLPASENLQKAHRSNSLSPSLPATSMSSPSRFSQFSGRTGQSENASEPANPQPQVFAVAPLNSAPYIGPAMTQSHGTSVPTRRDSEAADKVSPALIYMPPHSTKREWDTLVAATHNGIALTGSAALGKMGPAIGLLDIGESEDSYLFRVSLPGVAREKDFSCEIEPDGKVVIKGITMTGEKIVCKNSMIFEMQTQNLCPPGHFSITFYLPGAVDHQQYSGYFGIDGILEGVVKRR